MIHAVEPADKVGSLPDREELARELAELSPSALDQVLALLFEFHDRLDDLERRLARLERRSA
jgi:hypothetical protein